MGLPCIPNFPVAAIIYNAYLPIYILYCILTIYRSVSADEGLRDVLIYLTLCYVHCSRNALFAIAYLPMYI